MSRTILQLISPLLIPGGDRGRSDFMAGCAICHGHTGQLWRRPGAGRMPLTRNSSGTEGGAHLFVLVAEVGGRWSTEMAQFLRGLAKARGGGCPHDPPGKGQGCVVGASTRASHGERALDTRSDEEGQILR